MTQAILNKVVITWHLLPQRERSHAKILNYPHLSNKCGGWNKRGGEAKITKSLNAEAGINVEVGKYL